MPDPHSAPSLVRSTTTTVTEEKPKGGLSLTQVLGGALAAVTAAVAASFLGVAGTLIGAALGSVVSTIAATLYSNSLTRAAKASRTLVVRQTLVPARPRAEPELADRPAAPSPEPHPLQDSIWQRVRWKPVLLVAGGVFIAAMAVISVSELVLGHPIANATESGTTLTNLGGGSASQPTRTPTPTSSSSSTSGTATTTPATPTTSATPTTLSPTPSASVPSSTGGATPTTPLQTEPPAASSVSTAPGAGGASSSTQAPPAGG
jgi:hypothetical protein